MCNLKKLILISLFFVISSCSLNNYQKIQKLNYISVEVVTPNDKYNVYFKKNLKRFFHNTKNNKNSYILNTKISFESTNTMSISGTNVLKSTKANVNYNLKNKKTNEVVKYGSIKTFPALSSSSSSLFTQQKSVEHIKERLTKSSAKSLYMHLKIILNGLS